jgi:hypothetical protein
MVIELVVMYALGQLTWFAWGWFLARLHDNLTAR